MYPEIWYDVMYDLDPEGLAARCPIRKRGKAKGHFTTTGSIHWMDMIN